MIDKWEDRWEWLRLSTIYVSFYSILLVIHFHVLHHSLMSHGICGHIKHFPCTYVLISLLLITTQSSRLIIISWQCAWDYINVQSSEEERLDLLSPVWRVWPCEELLGLCVLKPFWLFLLSPHPLLMPEVRALGIVVGFPDLVMHFKT